jgi:hypothetical protein
VRAHTILAGTNNRLRNPDGSDRREDFFVVSDGDEVPLVSVTAFGLAATKRRTPVIRLSSDGKSIAVHRQLDDAYIELRNDRQRGSLGTDPKRIAVDGSLKRWSIHFGPDSDNHRAVEFVRHAGAQQ